MNSQLQTAKRVEGGQELEPHAWEQEPPNCSFPLAWLGTWYLTRIPIAITATSKPCLLPRVTQQGQEEEEEPLEARGAEQYLRGCTFTRSSSARKLCNSWGRDSAGVSAAQAAPDRSGQGSAPHAKCCRPDWWGGQQTVPALQHTGKLCCMRPLPPLCHTECNI